MSLSVEDQSHIASIWDLLDRPSLLLDSQAWPGNYAIQLHFHIVPPHAPDTGPMPLGFAYFISKDLRLDEIGYRVDRGARYMAEDILPEYNKTWLNIIHSFLVVYTNCSRATRGRGANRLQSILRNFEGRNVIDENEENFSTRPEPHKTEPQLECDRSTEKYSIFDMQKSIQAMASLFPECSRPTGAELENFTVKLKPVLDQMDALKIPSAHNPAVLFSLLCGKARQAASKVNLSESSLEELVTGIKRAVLYDCKIKDRRVTRWTHTTYETYRSSVETEEAATRKCIEQVTDAQQDLPQHMPQSEHLLSRIRDIFRPLPWCETLFQRLSIHEDASSFSQKLITAAASEDLRRKRQSQQSIKPYFSENGHDQAGTSYLTNQTKAIEAFPDTSKLVMFFSKTPPPPHHRRPAKFRDRRFTRPWSRDSRFPPHRRFPTALRRFQQNRKRICFGCRLKGHFLRNCPERERYRSQLNAFVNLGQTAAYILNHEDSNAAESDHELPDFFDETLNVMISELDESNVEFDTWVCNLLDKLDHIFTEDYLSVAHSSQAHFVKHSIPELSHAMKELVLHSSVSINRHMLLDTGAPRSICTETWLEESNWIPAKKITLPEDIPPFRFAGHPVKALYGACLNAMISDLKGKSHTIRLFEFVLPNTPVPFLVGLSDQRRHAFDICLRKHNGSHLQVNAWKATFPLVITSHVWLPFTPSVGPSTTAFTWNELVTEALASQSSIHNIHFLPAPTKYDASNQPAPYTSNFPIPPWERDDWTSSLNANDIKRLHTSLRHPDKQALLKLIRQQLSNQKVPQELRNAIENHECKECAEFAQLPRTPKLVLPPESAPNVVVSLDVISHSIQSTSRDILVMLDSGDLMMRLGFLSDRTARTSFLSYFSKWIAYFDSPFFTVVDRGSNLAALYMAKELRILQSQLCPIATEAPWSIGSN